MYKLEKEYELTGKIIYLGDETNKICRFCGKTEPEVKFEKKAHVVSEFLGNRSLFSHYECDECNERFSKYEGNLADALMFYRGVIGAKRKKRKGGRRVKISNSVNSMLNFESGTLVTKLRNFDYKKDHVLFAYNENQALYIIEKQVNFFYCYKSLVKFAVSILPDTEISKCQKHFDVLKQGNYSQEDSFNYLYYIKIFDEKISNPKVRFYKKKDFNSDYPSFMCSFDYDYFQFCIFLVLQGEISLKKIDKALCSTHSKEKHLRVQYCIEDKFEEFTTATLVNGNVNVISNSDN